MIIELSHTNASEIAEAALNAHKTTGQASGLVMTLVVMSTSQQYTHAFDAAQATAAEHPSRILMVVNSKSPKTAMDAEIRVDEGVPGDIITLRLAGELVNRRGSVVLPLLLPDLPVVAWWPGRGTEFPAQDPIGRLADRRITDATNADDPVATLVARARGTHSAQDTDLSWTRLTRWRALVASALDQCRRPVTSAVVEAVEDNAPAALMAAWLDLRLGVPVTLENSMGPGVTAVRLATDAGEVAVRRIKKSDAEYIVPNQPLRTASLLRRPVVELLSEEFRRLGPDDVYERTLNRLGERSQL